MLTNILLGLHLAVTVAVIILVLLQQGRGSDAGAVFGGSSQSVFGSRGSASFLSRLTAALATLFFVNSLVLAWLYNRDQADLSVTAPRAVEAVTDEAAEPQSDVPDAPDSN
nr:putative protein-export protein [uncultured bacterium]